jgi:GNAT superfamily N-acetyltransferase
MIDHRKRFESIPSPGAYEASQVVRELDDGLVLRRASPADADCVAAFNSVVHADPPDFEAIPALGAWARDLIDGGHPHVRPADTWIVEDTRRGRLASTLDLISHRFRYEDIEFDAGQVELVGTHPDYRNRGLVRLPMEALHAESEARGQRMQVISGIPDYYRQFGYEMALEEDAARVAEYTRDVFVA